MISTDGWSQLATRSVSSGVAGDRVFNSVSNTILIIALITCLFPFLWMIMNSFKTTEEIFLKSLHLPSEVRFGVFRRAWKIAEFSSAVPNSVYFTVVNVVYIIALSSLAAYPIARMRFPGRGFLSWLLIASIMISPQILLIPSFFQMRRLGLINNILSVVFVFGTLVIPFASYLLISFFKEIPIDIEESTKMDGCSSFRFYISFLLPLSKPVLSSLVILTSLWSWNEYLFSLTFLQKNAARTIPPQLSWFFGRYYTDWGGLFAALNIVVLPLVILYLFLQRYFIRGLTAGSIK